MRNKCEWKKRNFEKRWPSDSVIAFRYSLDSSIPMLSSDSSAYPPNGQIFQCIRFLLYLSSTVTLALASFFCFDHFVGCSAFALPIFFLHTFNFIYFLFALTCVHYVRPSILQCDFDFSTVSFCCYCCLRSYKTWRLAKWLFFSWRHYKSIFSVYKINIKKRKNRM